MRTCSEGCEASRPDACAQVYRLAHGVLRRLGAFTVHNARRKQQLLDEWRILQARLWPEAVTLRIAA